MTPIEMIAQERERQIKIEGWSAEHDDQHEKGELAMAAALYASSNDSLMLVKKCDECGSCNELEDPWPWIKTEYLDRGLTERKVHVWDKRDKHDRMRRLQIAGALIVAEIERLQRKEKNIYTICYQYIFTIAQILKNGSCAHEWDERRREIHDELIDCLHCDPLKLHDIVSSLDIWINFPQDSEITEEKVEKFANRLYKLVTSSFFEKSSYSEIAEMHKKLRALYFDNVDYDGWDYTIKQET